MKSLVEEYVQDRDHMRLFQQERAIYEVTELIESLLDDQGVSRSELARRLGQSRGWVTQLLDGEKNKTIRTIADVLAVLGHELRTYSQPIQIGVPPKAPALKLYVGDARLPAKTTTRASAETFEIPLTAVQ